MSVITCEVKALTDQLADSMSRQTIDVAPATFQPMASPVPICRSSSMMRIRCAGVENDSVRRHPFHLQGVTGKGKVSPGETAGLARRQVPAFFATRQAAAAPLPLFPDLRTVTLAEENVPMKKVISATAMTHIRPA